MRLSPSQLVMVQELKLLIAKLKSEGKDYPTIREACINDGKHHWLVKDEKLQNEAVGAALFAYAMDDDQREVTRLISEAAGQVVF